MRWKSHYYDVETDLYYINGRYYEPQTAQYINADEIENILSQAGQIGGLDRYAIAIDNPLNAVYNPYTIATAAKLYPDPTFDPYEGKGFWFYLWKNLQYVLFATVLLTSLVLLCFPGTQAFGLGMLTAGLNGAISGFLIGGIVGGIISAVQGNSFLEGACKGAINGAINGFTASALLFCLSSGISAIANKIKTADCFAAGTLVLTADGNKPIEDIEVGDKVWAYDEKTGQSDWKDVAQVFRNESKRKTTVSINSDDGTIDEIISTPGHKYYLPDNSQNRNPHETLEHASYQTLNEKWVSACDLKQGDKVLLANADPSTNKPKYGTVVEVKTEDCEPFTTYNFEVADFHTYYVGDNGVCVHNACPGGEYYRGGSDFTAKPGDVRYTSDGLVKRTHGVSVNSNPAAVRKFGTPHKIIDLPDGLRIIQRGASATHFEIVATQQMTFTQYQSLLSKIVTIPIP